MEFEDALLSNYGWVRPARAGGPRGIDGDSLAKGSQPPESRFMAGGLGAVCYGLLQATAGSPMMICVLMRPSLSLLFRSHVPRVSTLPPDIHGPRPILALYTSTISSFSALRQCAPRQSHPPVLGANPRGIGSSHTIALVQVLVRLQLLPILFAG